MDQKLVIIQKKATKSLQNIITIIAIDKPSTAIDFYFRMRQFIYELGKF
jgi:hypothetical protein